MNSDPTAVFCQLASKLKHLFSCSLACVGEAFEVERQEEVRKMEIKSEIARRDEAEKRAVKEAEHDMQSILDAIQTAELARKQKAIDADLSRKQAEAVIEKAMSPSLLINYASIMESVSGSFETSMPYDKIAELVRNQLDNGGSWNIVNTSVNGTGDYKVPYSMSTEAYVMVPDQATVDAAKAKIQQVYNGEFVQ